ncbi:MAG: helix-turn-helix domain-containing protein [Terriglobia bacterium]
MNNGVGTLIRRIRARIGLSQEGLARSLNTSKAAIQHWEHGRNRPDLARLADLRRICPPGPERNELDSLLRNAGKKSAVRVWGKAGITSASLSATRLGRQEKEDTRLRKAISRLELMLRKKEEQIRILGELATQLQREILELRASRSQRTDPGANPSSPGSD